MYNSGGLTAASQNAGGSNVKSSSHAKHRCQYHIVFAPKYRRNMFLINCKLLVEQISIKEYIDLFTGRKKRYAKKTAAREHLPDKVMRN